MEWQPTADEIQYYKNLNQDKAANDSFYEIMLPLLLEKVNDDYNQSFEPTNLPANVKLFFARAIQHYSLKAGLESRRMGSVSYSYDLEALPKEMTDLLRRYRKVRFRALRD